MKARKAGRKNLPHPSSPRASSRSGRDIVGFCRSYAPVPAELDATIAALKGSPGPNLLGFNYLGNPELHAEVREFLEGVNIEAPEKLVLALADERLRAANLQLLTLKRPIRERKPDLDAAKVFLLDLKDEVEAMDSLYREKFNFSEKQLRLLHEFIARTAPLIYCMGFPDAVRHSGQVSRLCAIYADRLGGSQVDKLQAAMVGWLHDPKFPIPVSWDNLATHPVIASAIALEITKDPNFSVLLSEALADLHGVNGAVRPDPENFSKGLVEAISINNDSKFVLDNAILKERPQDNLPRDWGVSAARREAFPALANFPKLLVKYARQRFHAMHSGEGKKPHNLTRVMERELSRAEIGTGIRSLRMDRFSELCQALAEEKYPGVRDVSAQEIVKALLSESALPGLPPEERIRFEQDVQQKILNDDNIIHEFKISPLSLFSHHKQAVHAPVAAKSLAIADPLLLSAHKILASKPSSECLVEIRSYLKSFEDNIRFLPGNVRKQGNAWKRDIYRAMLEAACVLTEKNPFEQLPDNWEKLPAPRQAQLFRRLLESPSTWRHKNGFDYGKAKATDPSPNPNPDPAGEPPFRCLLWELERHYNDALNKSPVIFGE